MEKNQNNTKSTDSNEEYNNSHGKSSSDKSNEVATPVKDPRKKKIPHSSVKHQKEHKGIKGFIAQNKKRLSDNKDNLEEMYIRNDYANVELCRDLLKKSTGLIFDDEMMKHTCIWDPKYAENPVRYQVIIERFKQMGLIERCYRIPSLSATEKQITRLHSIALFEKLNMISSKTHMPDVENEAAKYDSVYFNEATFNSALLAAGSAINLVENICKGVIQNGIAVIRPPGHHAMHNEFCGYCYFNNVAIAAQYALDENLANKILIVDVDVHHGQATQQMFYNDNRVLYFSIHRYEYGNFWPNLRESNYDYIGCEMGTGYNINFPLNAIGLEDSDYLSIILHILLPTAYEFQPDLIILSSGYDSCIGCLEGEMEVTPGFYGHLITLLSGLAQGKIAVCLEGGYFLPSLAEGTAMTLKALLGDPPATLMSLDIPHPTVVDMINNLKLILRNHWLCFRTFDLYREMEGEDNYYKSEIKYMGTPLTPPYPTRDCYPIHSLEYTIRLSELISSFQREYTLLGTNQAVAVCYDEAMLLHRSNFSKHVEVPERIAATYALYKEWQLDSRCININAEEADVSILSAVHKPDYISKIISNEFSKILDDTEPDLFHNDGTSTAITKAISCLLAIVDSVVKEKTRSGVAIIRPPGHHAEADKPGGFCFINNIAIAAQYLLDNFFLNRILIVDFDIHHGNGTQNMFYSDNRVLYISIHKHDPIKFYPNTVFGGFEFCGKGPGKGYNVNIPLTAGKLYDVDYITIFHEIILPIAYSYNPNIILVSAGFDAGVNDMIGHYAITPECFGHFIQLLKPLANGKLILALEGGYNTVTVKYGMNACIKTLLGDPLPMLDFKSRSIAVSCRNIITYVKNIQKEYWPVLGIDRKLIDCNPLVVDGLEETTNPYVSIRKNGRFLSKLNETFNKPSLSKSN